MNDFINKEEREIINACISGKTGAQERLFKKYYSYMLGVCLRYCGNKMEARDLLQEGFIKVFNNVQNFKFESSFLSWMRRIFMNIAIDHYRKSVNIPKLVDLNEIEFETGVEEDIFSRIDANDMLKCMNELSINKRTIFNLYAIEGLSHKEIAELLNISEGTSKSQYSRARKYLKEIIEKRYFIK